MDKSFPQPCHLSTGRTHHPPKNMQFSNDGFDLQDKPFRVIVSDDFYGFGAC
jgi:hypothetical protein